MPLKSFRTHELSHLFIIDRSTCIINGEINNEQLFSTFSQFSDEDPESVRTDIIKRIESSKHIYEAVGIEFFQHREWNITEWAMAICSQYYYGDELLLFVMCRVFHRHALVICRNCYWCTFEIKSDMDIHEVLDACDLHLVHICPGIFASLHLKQRQSAKISPPKFPHGQHIEEILQRAVPQMSILKPLTLQMIVLWYMIPRRKLTVPLM